MKTILMSKGAKTLVDVCAAVKSRENVLIVTDFMMTSIAEAVAIQAFRKGAEVTISSIAPRTGHGQEPPPPVSEAMKKADVIFTPVTYSISSWKSWRSWCIMGSELEDIVSLFRSGLWWIILSPMKQCLSTPP